MFLIQFSVLQSTERVTDHEFYIDITQYFMRQPSSTASFNFFFPEGNAHFERVGIPRPKTQTIIVGFIMASSQPISNTCAVKRLPVEIGEIQYLPSTVTAVSSSQKGMSLHLSLSVISSICRLGGMSSRFRKKQSDPDFPVNSNPSSSSTIIQPPPSISINQAAPLASSQGSETMSDRDVNEHEGASPAKRKRRA
jgi:hypothetical protein